MKQHPTYQKDTGKPNSPLPPKSCDCQVHVFGDTAKYPLRSGSAYVPPLDATIEEAERMHRALGIERGVVVQSTVHGKDHRILFDALKGRPNYRGIALVDDETSDRDLQRLHDAGVRGARFNFWKRLNIVPSAAEFKRATERIGAMGWHAKVHAVDDEWLELKDLLCEAKLPIVIDHLGHLDVSKGPDNPSFKLLLDLVRNENCWMLVSNGDRMSLKDEPWDDVVPLAQEFIKAAPERIIWCSDWPHVWYEKSAVPNDAQLVDLLYAFAPSHELRRKILVENPARLFGFDDR